MLREGAITLATILSVFWIIVVIITGIRSLKNSKDVTLYEVLIWVGSVTTLIFLSNIPTLL